MSAITFQEYPGVDSAKHQTNVETLRAQGYRMISLSVYGDADSPLYAAVWVKRSGPKWEAVHGVNSTAYETFINEWKSKGYKPVLVSATGPRANAVYAAVVEEGAEGEDKKEVLFDQFLELNADTSSDSIRMRNLLLRSFAIYGEPTDRRVIAVWQPNPGYVKWFVQGVSAADFTQNIDLNTQLPGYFKADSGFDGSTKQLSPGRLNGYRLAGAALSAYEVYCYVFADDVVGPWKERHGMTRVECEAELKDQKDAGYYPICLQGGGTTAKPVYAAIFAKQDISDFLGRKDVADIPLRREWSVTSDAAPSWGESFDKIFQEFMKANGVRAAQFALSKNGLILLSRGYNWAEPGYRITNPTDRFLLASCSKLFCAQAIQTLFKEGLVEPSTRAYPLLNQAYPSHGFSNPPDLRSDSITIQQLLDHRGGYNHGRNSNLPNSPDQDPTYDMRAIGLALNPPRKVEKLDVVRYMYGKQLQYTPGEGEAYSNYGYLLLSAIVECVTGKPYFQYVQQMVLAPLGLTDVRLASTQAQQRDPNQAICEDRGLGPDPINVTSNHLIPNVYGGDRQIKEVAAGSASLASSARVLTQFAGNYFRASGNLPKSFAGSTPGATSFVHSMPNGIDWAYVFNTREFIPPRPNENTAEDILKGKIGDKIESMPELR